MGISAGTLKQRLADSNAAPGEDHCYSSRQLFDACFGSLHRARLRQIEGEIKHTAFRTGILEGAYLERADLEHAIVLTLAVKKPFVDSPTTISDRKMIL